VVSIGNLSAGGSGKTPLTIALANALTQRGQHVDILSRGYGRRSQLPARVDANGTAEAFGDEPLLVARETGVPVYVASERFEVGSLVETALADPFTPGIHLLDDGFQHRQLCRDIDIVLLDRRDWHDILLPAGNLREPRAAARRATVLAVPAEDAEFPQELRGWGWSGPIWKLHRKMEVPLISGPFVAFCGIARAEQFFAGLEAAGLSIATRIAFADHHPYTPAELDRIVAAAGKIGAAAVITTEKDRLRLGTVASVFPESLPLTTARLRTEIDQQDEAIDWLVHRIELTRRLPSL
jgi:tetraacyldisaccharide 4'-kinase